MGAVNEVLASRVAADARDTWDLLPTEEARVSLMDGVSEAALDAALERASSSSKWT